MDRRSYIVVLYKGARMMIRMIMDEKITYDGVMFSKDDKPIYYTDYFLEVCKHFKVRCNDNYMSVMLEDGTWKDVSYDKFKVTYLSSFIQTMMSCDE